MHGFFARMISFFLSVFLFFGPFGKSAEVINMVPVDALSLTNIDITDGFAVTVPAASGTVHFNRVSFSYAASAAVRTVFVYRQGVNVREEELLLTSGAHSASMLLDGYLRRKTASRLLSVRFEPIVSGQNCVLSVSDFNCAVQDVPKGDTMYIENSRYKAGVSLKWGGGLCFFEDKQDDRYGNLLNNHDTGRLVQQSYYGPTQIDGYENGVFMGSVWGYNPVQGGDQFGNNSKLVAVEKDEKEIRVVCRPLDWALDNMPTQTYYTNVYRLTDAGLTVRNTAVDYLQAEWTDKAQELPAFYTISALGIFRFYDGDQPWTDAPLRTERDLPFWADKPAFPLQAGNSETWCAWTDNSDYGIGLFTPDATALLAGRFEYNGSADANDNATNYVAPLGFFKLQFDEPHTYYYYLTAGKTDEIRRTFRNAADSLPADPGE